MGGSSHEFEWSYTDEPHRSRRKAILAKYPQVKQLFGHDPATKYKVLLAVSIQVAMAYYVSDKPAWWVFFLAYTVGGTINHSMTLAMHEVSHNLAFRAQWLNRWFGMFTNLPLGLPAFVSFKRYHIDHHKYQGEDGVDTDIPVQAEVDFFRGAVRKTLWVIMQPLFYALRPLFVMPKRPTVWEGVNVAVQLTFDFTIWWFCGFAGLAYLIGGTLLGMGLHPMAGHFIAEHYAFIKGIETYSYYGPLNIFSFNVGYHNEHHDFPYISGSRLPELKALAPDFYDNLPYHTSWTKVIWRYITDPDIGPNSRVKRRQYDDAKRKRLGLVPGSL